MGTEEKEILSPQASQFLTQLSHEFEGTRQDLLLARGERQVLIRSGQLPGFLKETEAIRLGDWKVAPPPSDLENRRVEITGPAEPKMMINALNSGANGFMADLEDSLSPTWENVIGGQQALKEAARGTLRLDLPGGKSYRLGEKLATLMVRPRGWHLHEKHFLVDGKPISASLFDFGLYVFHNASELLSRGTGPYFYLPKMESHKEARLWNQVFDFTESKLKLPGKSIRATVLIETILAAYEMDEILFELRDHVVGLNAGRWDYLFSAIKKFSHDGKKLFPDRSALTMRVPFMQAYTRLLVRSCHKRGAHAIGGMAAFIPSRKDAQANELAFAKVREDKDREARGGFDGTWVAHPDLIAAARESFDKVLGNRPHQKENLGENVEVSAADLTDFSVDGAAVTEAGVRNNINVALQYLERWLGGVGAVGIFNLMEDAATAEISRAQLWQWLHQKARLSDSRAVDQSLYHSLKQEELSRLGDTKAYEKASVLLDELVLSDQFSDFLTVPAYELLP